MEIDDLRFIGDYNAVIYSRRRASAPGEKVDAGEYLDFPEPFDFDASTVSLSDFHVTEK